MTYAYLLLQRFAANRDPQPHILHGAVQLSLTYLQSPCNGNRDPPSSHQNDQHFQQMGKSFFIFNLYFSWRNPGISQRKISKVGFSIQLSFCHICANNLSSSWIPEAKGMFFLEILEVLGLDPLEPPLWLEKNKNPSWLWITQLGQLVCSDCPRVSTGKNAKSCGIMEKGHDETLAWSRLPSGEQDSRLTSFLEKGDFHRFVLTRMGIDYLPCIVLSYWVHKSYSFLSKMLKLPRQTCFNKVSQYSSICLFQLGVCDIRSTLPSESLRMASLHC